MIDVEQIVRGENALLGDFTDALSAKVEQAIHDSMQSSDRSLYAAGQRIGVSDIGTCREYVRRMIVGLPWSDPQEDYSAAFMGTAVGDHIEAAMTSEEVHSQVTVTVNLKVRGYQMSVPGHVDLVGPDWMTDIKSKAGLTLVRRVGPSLNNIFQATLYAAALIESGDLPEDCMVSLTFVDRSGVEKTPYVVAWRFSRAIVDAAVEWLDDTLYAVENNEEASKDKPRDWCWNYCPYATDCRGRDTDASGLIEDPVTIEAIAAYREANGVIRAAEKDKKSALTVLSNTSGSTGEFAVRWVEVPGGHVEYDRAPYRKIDIRRIRKGKS